MLPLNQSLYIICSCWLSLCFVCQKQTTISRSKVDALKIEIGKGTKEMRALQLMIQTYTNTPQVRNLRALIRSCLCGFRNSRFVFFSLATQPNSNQSLTQWRPECRNRRRNSRLCRWNTFCIGSLCGCFIKGFMDLPEDFKVWKLDLRNEEKFTTIYFSRETLTWLKARWVWTVVGAYWVRGMYA